MTHRRSPAATAMHGYHGMPRGSVNSGSEDSMMGEIDADLMKNDSRKGIERPQNYGFASAILPRSKPQGGGQGQQGGGSQADASGGGGSQGGGEGNESQQKGESAEAFFIHPGSSRSHPIAAVVDDRRHRPRKMKPGESIQYDDQKQASYLARDGAYFESPMQAVLRHTEHEEEKQQGGKSKGGRDMTKAPKKVTASVTANKGKVSIKADDGHDIKSKVITLDAESEIVMKVGGQTVVKITGGTVYVIAETKIGLDAEGDAAERILTASGPAKKAYAKVS